jgi:hypothetical protein
VSDSTPSNFRPLFRLDPGWPFVLAGLALLIAGILIPVQRELHELRGQQKIVEATEARVYARLEAYDRFLTDLRAADPDLVRRLAIANLNMVPKGEQSLLLTPGLNQSVAEWIDESVPPVQLRPEPYPDTLLGRLAVGPNRLWMLAASVFLLFVGLLFGPDPVRSMPTDGQQPTADDPNDEGGVATATEAPAETEATDAAAADDAFRDPLTDRITSTLPAGVAGIVDEDDDDDHDGDATETFDADVVDVEVVDDAEDEDEDGDEDELNRSPSELTEAFEDRVRGDETDRPIAPPKGAD